jgi:hypothetical protein
MHAQPQKEHEWLHKLIGEWTTEHECSPGPDQPTMKIIGREIVRSLGGLWVVCEGTSEIPGGGTSIMIITLGYDPARNRFVGSCVSSMMHNLWIYDGQLDEAGNVLALDTEGPSFTTEGKTTKYKDYFEIKGNAEWVLRSECLGDDGKWHHFMTMNCRRTK